MELKDILEAKSKLHADWELTHNNTRLHRKLSYKNFKLPFELTVKIGELAEREKHHPELKLGWGYLEIELYTHTINGLAKNDFNFAQKIDVVLT